jgi:hypothetical protein
MPGGLTNPNVIDLVTYDTRTDEVVLVMVEDRDWGGRGERIPDLEAKVLSYVNYFLEDRIAQDYPGMAGKLVRLQLLCKETPGPLERDFLSRVRKERLRPLELRLSVRVLDEQAPRLPVPRGIPPDSGN